MSKGNNLTGLFEKNSRVILTDKPVSTAHIDASLSKREVEKIKMEEFEARNAAGKREDAYILADLNRGRGDNVPKSRHPRGGTVSNMRRAAAKKRRQEENDLWKIVKQILKDLERRLEQIDNRMREIDAMKKGIADQLKDIAEGQGVELDENGNLKNKQSEKALREYEKKHGKKVDRNDPLAVQRALQAYEKELNQENDRLGKEREILRDEAIKLDAEYQKIKNDPAEFKMLEEINSKGIEVISAAYKERLEQVKIQETEGVHIRNQAERNKDIHVDTKFSNVDDEVGSFMKEFSAIKNIKDGSERMIKEKELVAGLSPEAKDNLSFEDSTAYLFEENYFKQLETKSGAIVTNVQTAQPILPV